MLIFEPFDPNIDPSNPPKKKKILETLNSENDKLSNFDTINHNNDEKENSLNKKQKEIMTQNSQKSIIFNNLILKKNQSQKTCNNNFKTFLTKSKFYKSKTIHNNENDDALVVQYSCKNESSDNSYIFNLDNNINDSSDINKTESNIEDEFEKEGKEDKKKLGISIHKTNKENNNNKVIRFEKNSNDDLDDNIDYKNKTLNLGDKKSRINQINLLENRLNKSIKLNSPEKKNSNMLPRVYPQKKKISFNEPLRFRSKNNIKTQNFDDSMIRTAYNNNNKLNINKINSMDNENEINIERNEDEDKGKYIETITPLDEDVKIHNNRKLNKKSLKSILKSRNKNQMQMLSTDLLFSNDGQKLKNSVKSQKDKNMNSSKQINRRKRSSNNTILGYLNRRKKEVENDNKNKNNIGNMRLRNKKVNMAYTDEELQEMEFVEALYNDNRPFIRMYWAYLKEEHIIFKILLIIFS
jgi:hypothetical protein